MLPDIPGTEVCRQLRREPRTAGVFVMMVTAKGEEIKALKAAKGDKSEVDKFVKENPDWVVQGEVNLMFKTNLGPIVAPENDVYLRPETAQGMFVNFKNIIDSIHPKLPFGLAQIGKAFRNEIAPRDFTFRVREFEQMEIEYFVKEADWQRVFEEFRVATAEYFSDIGLDKTAVHELDVAKEDLAHYSKRTIDFEFDFPFGRKELSGLAYRTDFDLKAHSESSGQDLSYLDEEAKARLIPHVIEPSFGLDRAVLAVISSAYTEDTLGGETRTYMKFSPKVAPITVAVFPLLRNKPELVNKAREIYMALKKEFGRVAYDDNGNIGKRYRRQDEIGTPFCVTVDFDTIEKDDMVTLRDRDSGKQERVAISDISNYLKAKL
jgi:glycyl-tRNA synthetase